MYTKRELKRAAGIIRQIARDNHVTEEEVDDPTLEEFILWMAEKIKESGD